VILTLRASSDDVGVSSSVWLVRYEHPELARSSSGLQMGLPVRRHASDPLLHDEVTVVGRPPERSAFQVHAISFLEALLRSTADFSSSLMAMASTVSGEPT
jgi:hypothetical protein